MQSKHLLSKIKLNEVSEIQPLARYLILLFRTFESDLIHYFRKHGYEDITLSDLQILHFVRPEGSQVTEIARLAGISKQAVGKTISSLEARNYLHRVRHKHDGRSQLIQFTTKGKTLFKKAIKKIRKIELIYQKCIGKKSFGILKKNLEQLLQCHPLSLI